jgi:hypothetical protein
MMGATALTAGIAMIFVLLPEINFPKTKAVIGEGATTDYSMAFSSSKNKFGAATTESTYAAKTDLGNEVSFAYNNIATALGYWGKTSAGGYVYNTTPINGLKSIAITFKDTNGVKISYGWAANAYRVSDVALAATAAGGTAAYAFGNEMPSYFKIAYDSAVATIKK